MLLAPSRGGLHEFGDLVFSKCASLKQMIQELYGRPKEVMTIVRYDPHSRPRNRYPREIVSPPAPSACCRDEMGRLGRMERGEGGWPYFYKRCQACGYTVREFVGYAELAQLVLRKGRQRREGLKGVAWRTWIARVFAE